MHFHAVAAGSSHLFNNLGWWKKMDCKGGKKEKVALCTAKTLVAVTLEMLAMLVMLAMLAVMLKADFRRSGSFTQDSCLHRKRFD